MASLSEWARRAQAEIVVCTRKDLVKLETDRVGDAPLRALGVELQFLAGEEGMVAALEPFFAAAKCGS